MGFIPEDKINEIRDRVSIVTVISQYVHLKKIGANYKAPCPFHAEKTPSFVVSESKKIYHCFGCGKGGNVFTFLMEQAGLSFPEAIRKLASEAGISLPEISTDQKYTRGKKEIFYKINRAALIFFKEQLRKNKEAQQFLVKRGVGSKICSEYHLGYAADAWSLMSDYFKRRGVSEKHLLELGLMVQKDSSSGFYDRFRKRIIFPLFDLSQRVVGFGGRGLDLQTIPKYLNSMESPIYYKGKELYGLMQAVKGGGEKLSKVGVIIVEGYFDCLLLVQAGFKNVVATMGTALTSYHIDLLKRFTDRFYLLFDGDEAGKNASERSLPLFLQAGISPKVVELPMGEDPDDFIRKNSKEVLRQKIKESLPLLDFVVDRKIERTADSFSSKTKIIEDFIPLLANIRSGIEREEVVKRVSDRLQIDEKWLLKPMSEYAFPKYGEEGGSVGHLGSTQREQGSGEAHWKNQMRFETAGVEMELLEFFILFPKWLQGVQLQKILDLFTNLEVKTVGLVMMSQYQQTHTLDFPSLLEKIESQELKKLLMRGTLNKESQNLSEFEWRSVFEDCLKRLRRNHLEQLEKKLLREIKACEKKSDLDDKKVDLLGRYQEIVRQKQQYL